MAARPRRPAVADSDAELAELRDTADTPAGGEQLRALLATARGRIVAQVAKLIRAQGLDGFEPALVAAFARLVAGGHERDPGCLGKVAVLEALDFGETLRPEPFLVGVVFRQPEPAWGPPVDTATGVRARSLLALARLRHPSFLLHAAEALVDPETPVRAAAADALAYRADPAGAATVLLKLRAGDAEPEVLLACHAALLALAPEKGLQVAIEALHGEDPEPAALALGECRRPEALDSLLTELGAAVTSAKRRPLLRGIGAHRSERAVAELLAVIQSGNAADAKTALEALRPRSSEPGVRERLDAAIAASRWAERLR